MISSTPGLIPQKIGKQMLVKYRGATFFIDENSDKVYVHLMCDHTAVSTFKVKHAYERLAGTSNVRILRYHADNGRFADASFSNDCRDNDQILTFLWCRITSSKWYCREENPGYS